MGVLTPYAISARYSVRISAAKDFLEELQANGILELVSASHNLKIYKPKAA
jgi:ribosomal protein S25